MNVVPVLKRINVQNVFVNHVNALTATVKVFSVAHYHSYKIRYKTTPIYNKPEIIFLFRFWSTYPVLCVTLFFSSLSSILYAKPFPVYFADVIKENNKEILHFEWRPDYGSYDKALITDSEGELIGEVEYPRNKYDITKLQGQSALFITAVSTNGENSEAVKVELNKDYSSLYAKGPAERIVIKNKKRKNACFVGTESGKEVIVKGVNFCGIRLGAHDSFEPTITATQKQVDVAKQRNRNPVKAPALAVTLGEPILFYDPLRSETLMRTLKSNGFNLVRVFIRTGERDVRSTNIRGLSGPYDTKGISVAYMDNFIDFLTRAQKYGIYVMPCFCENEMLDNDYFRKMAKGATKQGILFSEDGIKAKQHYLDLFLTYIKEKDPKLINSLFALTMQNEFAFHSNHAPFNQTSGTYTFIDGTTYDMTNNDERRALANAAIKNYYTKMKQAVEANVPGLPVGEGTFSMGAVGKTYENSKGFRTIEGNKDLRFPMTAVELLNTDIDFLDFHVYRWGAEGTGADVFNHFAENMKLLTPEAKKLMKSKPIIMGEFGSFIEDEATIDEAIDFVTQLNQAALDFGFKGSAYWTIDTFVQIRIWNLMWENEKMLKAFSE